ncbi:MAG: hypothetical protein ACRDIZ_10510 [Actinomycetota bacterium]
MPIRLRTRLWLGGLAAAGVVVAHVLAYWLAAPNPVRREHLLEATGHGAWPILVALTLGALVASMAGFAAGRVREARGAPAALIRGTVTRLVTLQVVGFILLEALERLAIGHDLTELLSEPVMAIGLGAQVVVALAGAILLVLFAHLVDRLVILLHPIPLAPRVLLPGDALDFSVPRSRFETGAAVPRGPPGTPG